MSAQGGYRKREINYKNNTAMKKLLAILAILFISQMGYGQKKMNQLFDEFRRENNVNSVNIGKITLKLAGPVPDRSPSFHG